MAEIWKSFAVALLVTSSYCSSVNVQEAELVAIDNEMRSSGHEFSGELKNTVEHLPPSQRTYVKSMLSVLTSEAVKVGPELDPLVRLYYMAARLGIDPRDGSSAWSNDSDYQEVEARAKTALKGLLQDHPEMVGVDLELGPFPAYLTMRKVIGKRTLGPKRRADLKEPHLREQVGFYPEGPEEFVKDLAGYPQPQYAVYAKGPELQIRVPIVFEGRYICDLAFLFYHRP